MSTSTGISNGHVSQFSMEQREAIMASLALLALGLICGLAFFSPAEKVVLADKVAFLFLTVLFATLLIPGVLSFLEDQPSGGTFALTAAMFLIYSLARRLVPEGGPSVRFASMPEDDFIFPYAAYIAVGGATLAAPFWWKFRSDWTRSVLAAMAALGVLASLSFWFLARVYPVGPTQRLDPSPLPNLIFNLVEFACVALLCRAAGAHTPTRRLALRALPFVLLMLWVRFHFLTPAEAADPEEAE